MVVYRLDFIYRYFFYKRSNNVKRISMILWDKIYEKRKVDWI